MIAVYIILSVLFVVCLIKAVQFENNKKATNYDRASKLSTFSVEAPNRLRIFRDSMRIIDTTYKIQTFTGRVSEILSFLDWADEQVKNGMPLRVDGSLLKQRCNIYEKINSNALRMALSVHSEWVKHRDKDIDKCTIKAFEQIDILLSILKTGSNKDEIQLQINKIRNRIEDYYSDHAQASK